MQKIVGVSFNDGGKAYYYNPGDEEYAAGDFVVVEANTDCVLGKIAFASKMVEDSEVVEPLKMVIRKATNKDLDAYNKQRQRIPEILKTVKNKVRELDLQMKIVDANFSIDGGKLIIDFTADDRVDFRQLLKELASALKTRIELKQIGQRDEVKIKGGIGPCGEICCCKRFLNDFEHVTVKMAKNQGLSLSPTKISGLCGRLMCCLAYENSNYEEILKRMPKVNSSVQTPNGKGTVVYNDLLRELVSVKRQQKDETFVVEEYELKDIKQLFDKSNKPELVKGKQNTNEKPEQNNGKQKKTEQNKENMQNKHNKEKK